MPYVVDGEEVSIKEMTRRLPAYNKDQMAEAIHAGCTTTQEILDFLVKRELRAQVNQAKARKIGRRAVSRLYLSKANRG